MSGLVLSHLLHPACSLPSKLFLGLGDDGEGVRVTPAQLWRISFASDFGGCAGGDERMEMDGEAKNRAVLRSVVGDVVSRCRVSIFCSSVRRTMSADCKWNLKCGCCSDVVELRRIISGKIDLCFTLQRRG